MPRRRVIAPLPLIVACRICARVHVGVHVYPGFAYLCERCLEKIEAVRDEEWEAEAHARGFSSLAARIEHYFEYGPDER